MKAKQKKNLISIAVAALVVALFLGAALLSLPGPGEEQPSSSIAGAPSQGNEQAPAWSSDVELAALEGSEAPPGPRDQAPGSAEPAKTAPGIASERAAKRAKPSKGKKETQAQERAPKTKAPTYDIVVTPQFDISRVPDLDTGIPVALQGKAGAQGSARAGGGNSARELIGARPALALGNAESSGRLTATIMGDHPDAMPAVADIGPLEWGFDGAAYSASPTLTFLPVEARLELAWRAARGPMRISGSPSVLNGTARLIKIDSYGTVVTIDQAGIGGRRGTNAPVLRYRSTGSEVFIVGLPTQDQAGGDVIDPSRRLKETPDRHGQIDLDTTLRDITLPSLNFLVQDPFDQPMAKAQVIATVQRNAIARRTREGNPVVVDGFVFVKGVLDHRLVAGQKAAVDDVRNMDLGFVRQGASGKSSASGKVSLAGLPLGLYDFSVRGPFGTEVPINAQVHSSGAVHTVQAPVVGLEVQCPVEWRKDDAGKEAWARAKIKFNVPTKRLGRSSLNANTQTARRFLIPAQRPCTVTCTAKGFAPLEAKVGPRVERSLTSVLPRPVAQHP